MLMNTRGTLAVMEAQAPAQLMQLPNLHSVAVPIADPGDAVAFLARASDELGGCLLYTSRCV